MRKGELEVLLARAKAIARDDYIGNSPYYVVIQYGDHKLKSTTAHGNDRGRDPVWNEAFKFLVYSSAVDNPIQHKIILRIMDTFPYNDFNGSKATVHVGDLIALGKEEGLAELEVADHIVAIEDDTCWGFIEVGVSFRTRVEEN